MNPFLSSTADSCQYQSVEILPLRDYEELLYFLKDEYKELCKMLEPNIRYLDDLRFAMAST